jgi:hypothetical protein
MVSPSLHSPPERRTAQASTDVVLVVDLGHPAAEDYAAAVSARGRERAVVFGKAAAPADATIAAVMVFLGRLKDADIRTLEALVGTVRRCAIPFVGVVSSFRTHFGDQGAGETEAQALDMVAGLGERTVVFRPGQLTSQHSRAGRWLRRFGFSYPLVPRSLRSCFLDEIDLFTAIDKERQRQAGPRRRTFTLLGPNRPWRDVLAERRAGLLAIPLTIVSAGLALLLLGHVAALILRLATRWRPALRRWNFDTMWPKSLRELLELVNPYNRRYVQVVGYNNGVRHFGHCYPGRTVLSTVRCNRVVRATADTIKADCGATIRKAMDFLDGSGQELCVIPNYSYVCLGTAFFIPIHGSAADYSTVAATITRVVLYDPDGDRLFAAGRDEPAFRQHVFNGSSNAVVLRLYLRVKPKSAYYLSQEELENPTAGELLSALRDEQPANVEVRKSRAASAGVRVARFFKDPAAAASPVLELPRDRLGRLWDRLEENPVTSFVMHGATRWFAWHVELFFTAEDFATFWATHQLLPLRKIQLRYIRRDGLPHSPFRDHDCVSADMFMFRRHRRTFEAYLRRTFAVVRSNPGKHSR